MTTTHSPQSKLVPLRSLDDCKQQAEDESSFEWNEKKGRFDVTTPAETVGYQTQTMAETMLNSWRTGRTDDLFRGKGQR